MECINFYRSPYASLPPYIFVLLMLVMVLRISSECHGYGDGWWVLWISMQRKKEY